MARPKGSKNRPKFSSPDAEALAKMLMPHVDSALTPKQAWVMKNKQVFGGSGRKGDSFKTVLSTVETEQQAKMVIFKLLAAAMAGEPWAVQIYLDRKYGKVPLTPDTPERPEIPQTQINVMNIIEGSSDGRRLHSDILRAIARGARQSGGTGLDGRSGELDTVRSFDPAERVPAEGGERGDRPIIDLDASPARETDSGL